VVVTAGTTVPVLRQVTPVIPIVFAISRDPLGEGSVKSLARPDLRRRRLPETICTLDS